MILDTCALLWLAQGAKQFSPAVLRRLDEAAIVYVSAITAYEIGVKARSGKLILPIPARAWFQQALAHYRLAVLDLDPDICFKATELPPIHRDPCDRFIVATALVHDLPVVTADATFEKYGLEVLL